MNDQGEDLLARLRTVLSDAGFEEIAAGSEGVHLIQHARSIMVGWTPEELTQTRHLRGPRRGRPPAPAELPGLRHAFGLAMAAALRASGLCATTTCPTVSGPARTTVTGPWTGRRTRGLVRRRLRPEARRDNGHRPAADHAQQLAEGGTAREVSRRLAGDTIGSLALRYGATVYALGHSGHDLGEVPLAGPLAAAP
ncbi:hypothetical protein [Streptomyces roseus]|uniref:hypothetical protein n=1 Tax=Streptomyces roseus TaxID=66430 RepID=UPI00099B8E81|nr:hypothetical protein [Streptomyces roseus]